MPLVVGEDHVAALAKEVKKKSANPDLIEQAC